ncbi:hypothetical protein BGZ63DRAFT_5252 [Mariannaea sp. PMI_226]|nr:hypothetical protein BGZ63DRAFT_5252 [Mariannaea sp. PMI_226]
MTRPSSITHSLDTRHTPYSSTHSISISPLSPSSLPSFILLFSSSFFFSLPPRQPSLSLSSTTKKPSPPNSSTNISHERFACDFVDVGIPVLFFARVSFPAAPASPGAGHCCSPRFFIPRRSQSRALYTISLSRQPLVLLFSFCFSNIPSAFPSKVLATI